MAQVFFAKTLSAQFLFTLYFKEYASQQMLSIWICFARLADWFVLGTRHREWLALDTSYQTYVHNN